jgi:hypothetical protein
MYAFYMHHIQSFKRCHTQARLEAVVTSELVKWKTVFQIFTEGYNRSSENLSNNLIHSFSLSTDLRMIGCTKRKKCPRSLMKTLPKSGGKRLPQEKIIFLGKQWRVTTWDMYRSAN